MSSLTCSWAGQQLTGFVSAASSLRRSEVVTTGASRLSAVEEAGRLRDQEQWQQMIEGVLIEMGRTPDAFGDDEEGLSAPTPQAIEAAIGFAQMARDQMIPAPGQILPDGDGGVVIHRALADGATLSFEAAANGDIAVWRYQRAPLPPLKLWSSEHVQPKS